MMIVYLLPYSVSDNFCLFEVVIPVMWKLPIYEKNHTNLIYILSINFQISKFKYHTIWIHSKTVVEDLQILNTNKYLILVSRNETLDS